MFPHNTISRTELARSTRQAIEQARRGQTILVESYGEEQVAIVDVMDYRLLRAVATYRIQPGTPVQDENVRPQGLTEESSAALQYAADADPQIVWDLVVAAYLDGQISLGRAAVLLKQQRFELQARFNRLGLPLHLGPTAVAEGKAEYDVLSPND